MPEFKFTLLHTSKRSAARAGIIETPHGIIETPAFVPVGTNGTLKAIDSQSAEELGVQLLFCNTYHLMLHPGAGVVAEAGGLHRFMNRKSPLITDSGGFQVFSLAYGSVHDELKSKGKKQHNGSVIKITEEGVLFRSYRDGAPVFLTPESSVNAQKQLGADIIIPLDELPPFHITPQALQRSVERTHRWELRSLQAHRANKASQAMYGVVHGGLDKTLRALSCSFVQNHEFDGHAIGGSMGKTREQMYELLDHTIPLLRPDRPRHLLGIGDTMSCNEIVKRGIDTFDSAYPTKCARHGLFLKTDGSFVKITHTSFKTRHEPIDPECECTTCKRYSAAYLHHLFKVHELVALSAATIHNLHTMLTLTRRMRTAILEDRL